MAAKDRAGRRTTAKTTGLKGDIGSRMVHLHCSIVLTSSLHLLALS
jgi:hypothetical protein